jgi:hypothetical protein
MKFRNELWLILFREYISPNLFAVCGEGWVAGTGGDRMWRGMGGGYWRGQGVERDGWRVLEGTGIK